MTRAIPGAGLKQVGLFCERLGKPASTESVVPETGDADNLAGEAAKWTAAEKKKAEEKQAENANPGPF